MSRVLGSTLQGVEGAAIEVEVRISSQLPRVDIVGLPEAAVRESSARVRAAISAIGQRFPDRRVTINLAPAGLRKAGAGLDLPIAVGILIASGALAPDSPEGRGFIGELALDGRLRPVRGALALAMSLRDAGCRQVVVPAESVREAALAPGVEIVGAADLAGVAAHLHGSEVIAAAAPTPLPAAASNGLDLLDVRGQEEGKRALEIAAAGEHPLLLMGPPGAGKTMLAQRLPGLLPALSTEEAIEATRIHSAAGRLRDAALVVERPFRAPHHSASAAGLHGGGNPPSPGEISLAHRGVLFLDEILEFDRRALEALREVLEVRRVIIARAGVSCVFPASFILVAACNPCPCGWFRSGQRDCRCDPASIERYRRRLSGPLLDRIDLQVFLPAVRWKDLESGPMGEDSQGVRSRVETARLRQQKRAAASNAELPDASLDRAAAASESARQLLGRAVDRLGLSARAARRSLRVARTIADLAGEETIGPHAVAEALQYRGIAQER